jgi:hypothetical protein
MRHVTIVETQDFHAAEKIKIAVPRSITFFMLWRKFKDAILQLTGVQRIFIFCAMICAFCITADYGVVRPVSNSIFLTEHGTNLFPYAWLAIVPLNFLLVELYNRFLSRLGVLRMFLAIVLFVASVNTFCAITMTKLPFVAFFFYVWKEIYPFPTTLVGDPFNDSYESG